MGEKFNINTLFRMVIPGYLFLLVIFSLRPGFLQHLLQPNDKISVPLLSLLGIPVGFVFQFIQRFFFYCTGAEFRLIVKDREYITDNRNIRRPADTNKSSFKRKDNFYYAANIDYLLETDKKLKILNEHIRFLYTRMHSSDTAIVAISLAVVSSFIIPCGFSTIFSFPSFIFLGFWIGLIPCLFYIIIETGTRILWWRRLIVQINEDKINENITKG